MDFLNWWHKKRVFDIHWIKYNDIATIEEVDERSGLSLKENQSLMLVDDCEEIKRYWMEKINADGNFLGITENKQYGKYLKIQYTLFKSKKIHNTTFRIYRRIMESGDWPYWKNINLLFRSKNSTRILNFMIEEIDGDVWQYINIKKFKPDKWHLITIPLKKMYMFEKYPVEKKGNFKQNFEDVKCYWFDFSPLNGYIVPEEGPIKNVISIGKVFLTR